MAESGLRQLLAKESTPIKGPLVQIEVLPSFVLSIGLADGMVIITGL